MATAARATAAPFGTAGQPGAMFDPPTNHMQTTTTGASASQTINTQAATTSQQRRQSVRTRAAKVVLPIRRLAYMQWRKKLNMWINSRLDQTPFSRLSTEFMREYYVAPDVLADLLLVPRNTGFMLDGRVILYVNSALDDGLTDVPAILKALYKYSSLGALGKPEEAMPKGGQRTRWISSFAMDEVILWRLTKIMTLSMNGSLPARRAITIDMALHIVERTALWVELFIEVFATLANNVLGQFGSQSLRAEIHSTHGAFVAFLLKLSEHPRILHALSKPYAKSKSGFRQAITQHLDPFISSVTAIEVADRLSAFRLRFASLDPKPVDKKDGEEEQALMDDASVALALEALASKHIPPVNSRAGLYIFFNAALVGRPVINDDFLYNLIRNRYHDDMQLAIIDLILASFDVLANASVRKEHKTTANLLRSFLTNKLPLLISTLATELFAPVTAEYCITTALDQIDSSLFPTLSSMFDANNNSNDFTENMREEFTMSCVLHGLILATSIPNILGQTYASLPTAGKYTKAALIAQCEADPERAIKLLAQLGNTDGNAGAVVQALVGYMGSLCSKKDTAQLKMLCSQLARQPGALDMLQLFEKPVTLLRPLCMLLDDWKVDEDHGEYETIYDEFGSILLLVMAFAYRYNLSPPDIGLRSPDSFVAQLIRGGHLNKADDELKPEQDKHLTGWIEGLFGADSRGLSDELMASCPPQSFYLLVATLFKNMAVANAEGVLTDELLGTGIEYLVDTFLMPALVPAVLFLADQLSVDQENEQMAMIRILKMILGNAKEHAETRPTLRTVMNLTAKPLERALRRYQRRYPASQEVVPLLAAIAPAIPVSRRTGGADHNELETWCATPGGGLAIAVRQIIRNLVNWSSNPGSPPPSYTHRMFLVAIRRMTAQHVLRLIIDEIKAHQSLGMVPLQTMYDVAIALIIAPEVTNYPEPLIDPLLSENSRIPTQRRLTLREVLAMKAASWREFQKTDPIKAEILVRLHREVEGQIARRVAPVVLPEMGMGVQVEMVEDADENADKAGTEAVDGGLGSDMDLSTMDLSMVDGTGVGNGVGVSVEGLGGDSDLFGGLAGQEDFNWDHIDMMGL